jgi:hypothetical protein
MECKKNINGVKALVGGLLLAALSTPCKIKPAAAKLFLTVADAPIANTTPAPKKRKKSKNFNPLPISKPLSSGEIKLDLPLPAEDVMAKPVPKSPEPSFQGRLSGSQIKAMKNILEDAKKDADAGKLDEAIGKYNEFPDGPWKDAADQLKTEATDKYLAIEAAIKVADEAAISKDTAKFSQALTRLIAAVKQAR